MTNEIRYYLAMAVMIATETDDPSDDQLESIIAATSCALMMIRRTIRGSVAFDRVTAMADERAARMS